VCLGFGESVDLVVLGDRFCSRGVWAFRYPDAASGVRIYSLRKPYLMSSSRYFRSAQH